MLNEMESCGRMGKKTKSMKVKGLDEIVLRGRVWCCNVQYYGQRIERFKKHNIGR
jgi:hypothetical protein